MSSIEIKPQPGPQEAFLSSSADIAIIGGAAGGGKTWSLLFEPLRHINNGNFGAVAFRRTYPQITIEGGMWDESSMLYPHLGGDPKVGDLRWDFPKGSKVSFRHLQRDASIIDYYGSQIPLIIFDQLEQFTERMFFQMLTRNRSTCGVVPYLRGSCNPDPDSFLAQFLDWWIGEDGYARSDRAGATRWFRRGSDDELEWFSNERQGTKSVAFYPASVYDNKILLADDPGYLQNLKSLPLVERERLLLGNWKIKHEAGKVFNRGWFEIVNALPAGGTECRFWDFAATVKKSKGHDPDFIAGVRMLKAPNGYWYIADCILTRTSNYDNLVVNTTKQDAPKAKARGAKYMVRWETEPGSSGKVESARIARLLAGFDARGVRPQGDKVQRAFPLAAQSEANNVKVLIGKWNEQLLKQLHGFPDGKHDDGVDGCSGAFNAMESGVWFMRGV